MKRKVLIPDQPEMFVRDGQGWRIDPDGKARPMTWGSKISESLRDPNRQAVRRRPLACADCGKEMLAYSKTQRFCSDECRRAAKSLTRITDPIARKAVTLFGSVRLGTNKQETATALVRDALNKPCPYCGAILTIETISLDHISPVGHQRNRGKRLAFRRVLDRSENLRMICRQCNRLKGDLAHGAFQRLMAFLRTDPAIYAHVKRRLLQSGSFWKYKTKRPA